MLNHDRNIASKQKQDGEELVLLVNIRLGDRKAFADLYRIYHGRLYEFIRRFLKDSTIVEEVLDDVMLVVWKDCRKFRGDSRLSTWIFGIAYRKALKAMRAEQRYHAPLIRSVDPAVVPAHEATHDNWISTAIQRLSVDHRQVIVLTYYNGFSYKEIAKIANCPVNTVKTRMFHARRHLKSLLQELSGPPGEER